MFLIYEDLCSNIKIKCKYDNINLKISLNYENIFISKFIDKINYLFGYREMDIIKLLNYC